MGDESPGGRILCVDDEPSMREMLAIALEKDGHQVEVAGGGEEALACFARTPAEVVIHDLKMPRMNGLELLPRLRELSPETPVIVMTAFSTWDAAVEAMRLGAYGYLKKPFDMEEVRALVRRALAARRLGRAPDSGAELRLIGATTAIQNVLAMIRRISASDATVVVQGESGTGKELIARLIHLQSPRREGPFIAVNCGAFVETLLESEIFGHVRGAFTGAVADKQGLLALADGGSFFLDEVGEMTPQLQVRLLRALETREFLPVGGARPVRVDIRLIAATNRDLAAMVEAGTFREDLYYRLNVIPLALPPLRERREDIPLLAGHFLNLYNQATGRKLEGFTEGALEALLRHDWPGNIRELQNTVQRAVTLARGVKLTEEDVVPTRAMTRRGPVAAEEEGLPPEGLDLEARLSQIESRYLRQALERTQGNLTQAADLLHISFRSIRYKVKKLGLEK